jgi:hypothetical protein
VEKTGYGTVKFKEIPILVMAATLLMAQAPQAPLPAAGEAKAAQGPLKPGKAASVRQAQGLSTPLVVTGLVGVAVAGIVLAVGGGGGGGSAQPQSAPVTTTTTTTTTTTAG